jgi:probable HAF family extracellular repeat protein
VTFAPTAIGTFNGAITISDNAGKQVVTLSGTGVAAGANIPAGPNLGEETLSQSVEQSTTPNHQKHHTSYKVIDTGSFGGPNSHMSVGAQVLNNSGEFTSYADTPVPDPYAPDGCWDGDCLVAHVARWKNEKLTDLGALDAGPNSESNWISANGLIAGDSQNGFLDPFIGAWQIRGVLWKHGKLFEMGTLGGGYESLARSVNSSGVVVGLATTTVPDDNAMILSFGLPYPFQTRAYRWKNGVIRDLGTLGGADAMALGINEHGQIIGNSYTSDEPSPACGTPATGAFLWENGAMVNLGSLGGTCTQVTAINNSGQIVGTSSLEGDEVIHPFLSDRGKLRDLGKHGGNFASPIALNELGDAAGWSTLPGNDNIIHATLWTSHRVVDLGALGPDQCSIAFGINSRKQVVGLSGSCDFDDPSLRAFLWEPGKPMVDLNTLISQDLGIQLRNVATINEHGEMPAVGVFSDGTHRPVLLIPCDRNNDRCEDEVESTASSIEQSGNQFKASAGIAKQLFARRDALARWRERIVRQHRIPTLSTTD